jgi:hypothetical protein
MEIRLLHVFDSFCIIIAQKHTVGKVKPGLIVTGAKIVRFEKRGLLLSLPGGERGIIPLNRVSDDSSLNEDDIGKSYPEGMRVTCRLIEYSALDNIYIASLQQSMLKEDALFRSDQITPGIQTKVKICGWNSGGAEVSFGSGGGLLKGFIPLSHFPQRNPVEKFPVGAVAKARAIEASVGKPHVLFTLQPKLIRSKGAVLSQYKDVEVGMSGTGVVRKVVEGKGLQVGTIGGLIGFMPKSKIPQAKLLPLKSLFRTGVVLEYEVLEMDMEKRRMILVFRKEGEEEEENVVVMQEETEKEEVSGKKKRKASSEEIEETPIKEAKKKRKASSEEIEETPKEAKKKKKAEVKEQRKAAAEAEVKQKNKKEVVQVTLQKKLSLPEEEDSFAWSDPVVNDGAEVQSGRKGKKKNVKKSGIEDEDVRNELESEREEEIVAKININDNLV